MNPTRKRRLVVLSLILGAVGIAAALTVLALQQNITYLYTPVEVQAGKVNAIQLKLMARVVGLTDTAGWDGRSLIGSGRLAGANRRPS